MKPPEPAHNDGVATLKGSHASMRILHCSDFHGHLDWFGWLVANATSFDLVCLTGDHLDLLNLSHIDSQMSVVKAALARITVPIAVCSGNNDAINSPFAPPSLRHATWIRRLRRPGLWVDGDVFETNGITFRCIAWDARLPSASGYEVWLYHAPPARSAVAMDSSGGDVGDEILGQCCRTNRGPAAVLAGHQHDPQRWLSRVGRTWCFNPGHNRRCVEPNHIILDTTNVTEELVSDGLPVNTVHLGFAP